MSVKSDVLHILESKKGESVSGEALAEMLGCSRAAVWKAVKKISLDLPVVYMLIAIIVAMLFLNRGFFSFRNIISMFTSYSYYFVGAIGLVFVFISGNSGIDLSLGHVMGFSAVVEALERNNC